MEFKRDLSFSDELVLEQRRGEIVGQAERDPLTGERVLDARLIAQFVIARIVATVLNWNIPDARGAVLPITAESVTALRGDVIRFLGDEAARRLLGRPEVKEAPFAKRSPRSSKRARS